MDTTFKIISIAMALASQLSLVGQKPTREFYRLTIYHFQNSEQEKSLDNYFQNALLPALHRMKIRNVGVFKSWTNDTVLDKLIYVLTPFRSVADILNLSRELKKDAVYLSAGVGYLSATYDKAPYTRMETILLQAFPLAPQMQFPVL